MKAVNAFTHAAFGYVALVALAVARVSIILTARAGMSGDAFGYVENAKYIEQTGRLPAIGVHAYGFPLLLSPLTAIASDFLPQAVLWVHCAMDVLVVATLVHLIWTRFYSSSNAWPAITMCTLIIVQPFTATMLNSVYPDQSCGFLVFFSVYVLYLVTVHSKYAALLASAAGLMLGYAGIERVDLLPIGAGLIVGFLAYAAKRANTRRSYRIAIISLTLAFATPASILVALQYSSTGEIGLIKVSRRIPDPGYWSWLRTSFLTEAEYRPLAWDRGTENWEGFDIAKYPPRMFDSLAEKNEVVALLGAWKIGGMTPQVDAGFNSLAKRKAESNPIWHYVIVPGMRMVSFWINVDGAQVLLRVFEIRRPWSTVIVFAVVCLRLTLLALCIVGVAALLRHGNSGFAESSDLAKLAFLATVVVVLRTVELGALSIFFEAGLTEYRYMGIVFPTAMLVSIYGAYSIVTRFTRTKFRFGPKSIGSTY